MNGESATPSRARIVAFGILASRLMGLVRTKALAFFFGVGPHTDVLSTALRAPNILQNLLGEQTLSAAFIPIYSRLLGAGRREEAGRFAGAIFGLLLAVVSGLVALGVIFAEPIVAVLAAGYLQDAARVAAGEATLDRFPLAVTAARIVFPMTGFLVLAAWALGVLNSHRRFFLPYFAPVLWNAAMITALLLAVGGVRLPAAAGEAALAAARNRWLLAVCAGGLVGGLLQLLVQLPLVWRLMGGFRPSLSLRAPGVRAALRAVGPALAGRGVVQLSLYLDHLLATLLAAGAVVAVQWGGLLYSLPLSVFGMSVVAAELPELSRAGQDETGARMLGRVDRALRQSFFIIVPTMVGYLGFGYLVVALLMRGGAFGLADNALVYAVLCGYTLGLPASVAARLLQNTFFALGDTATPARIAAWRVGVAALLGFGLMRWLDRFTVADLPGFASLPGTLHLGAAGLSLAAGVGAWLELALLRRALGRRLPTIRFPLRVVAGQLGQALLTALPAAALWWGLAGQSIFLQAIATLGLYALLYLGIARLRRAPELDLWLGRFEGRREG